MGGSKDNLDTSLDSWCCRINPIIFLSKLSLFCKVKNLLAFVSASAYHNHLLTHQHPTHECEICHKKFQTKDKLRRHSLIHSGDKPFRCPVCDYRCNVEGNLRKHCLNSHQIVYPPKRRREVMKLIWPTRKDPALYWCCIHTTGSATSPNAECVLLEQWDMQY